MMCSKCGTSNHEGAKFCVRCGSPLQDIVFAQNNVEVRENVNMMNTAVTAQNSVSIKEKFNGQEYLAVLAGIFVKPAQVIKSSVPKFDDFKNSAILGVIVVVIATIASLIQSMATIVVEKRYTLFEGVKTTIEWENLKDLDYFDVIFKNLLLYIGIILAIAVVYYGVSLLFKKKVSFPKFVGIASLAMIPMVAGSLILGPLLGMLYAPLNPILSLIGIVYSLFLLYEMMSQEVSLEGNAKFYFHMLCMTILLIVGYFTYTEFVISSVADDLDSILNFMK